MISCQDADVLAAALAVGSVDTADEKQLQQHLARCRHCRRLVGDYSEAAARLPLALEPMQPSPDLRGRLMRAVYAEAASARRPAPAASPSWWRRLWMGVPSGRGFTAVGALASLAVIALGSWGLTHRSAAPAAPHNRPASLSIAVVATPAAPEARGQLVVVPSARQAVLTISGLPGPSTAHGPGSVYEVWLIRPNGGAVAAAYLSQAPDGTWSAAMHGDMAGYSAVATTIEPDGGSLTPTGTKVAEAFLAPPSSTPSAGTGGSS